MSRAKHEGIEVRHGRACASHRDARCSCTPTYAASVDLPNVNGRRRRRKQTHATLAAAKGWRSDALREVRLGTLRAQSGLTLRQAADEYLAGIAEGTIDNRSGRPYKPSAVRDIEECLRRRLLPALGPRKLREIRRIEVQGVVDRLRRDGYSASTIRRTVNALRAIYRHALLHDLVSDNPTTGLKLPKVEGTRDRIADPVEAAALLAALPEGDRALWATAMYAGLRRGELHALRWQDVDLDAGVIRVQRSWDVKEGVIAPKSAAGGRSVPIAAVLRSLLVAHRLASHCTGEDDLAFGMGPRPFTTRTVTNRADRHWNAAELNRITLHEGRHTYASLMIAANVNAKALSTYMGHASVVITFDRYGHLMPGNEAQAAGLLDAYLTEATGT